MEDFYSDKNILNIDISENLNKSSSLYVYVERMDCYISRVYFTNELNEIPIPPGIKFYKQSDDGTRVLVNSFNNSYFITWTVPNYYMTYDDIDILELNQHHSIKIKLM